MTADTSPVAGPSSAERSAKTTLLWGAMILASGIALVGVGSDEVGAIPVLAGLFLIILGIHTYGRLGPEDGEGGTEIDERARAAAGAAIWQGGLTSLAGLAVTLSTYYGAKSGGGSYVVAWGAMFVGAGRAWMGVQALRGAKPMAQAGKRSRRPQAKVEKRRRMDKSPPP